MVALIAGCAGPSAGPSRPAPAAFTPDLVGTWNGVFWWLGGNYWEDEGTLLLQIKEDGTFTVTMTPTPAANNIAKPTSWSGTVSQSGRLVVFHLSKGAWPAWSSLARSGDALYGVANDPATGADIPGQLRARGAPPRVRGRGPDLGLVRSRRPHRHHPESRGGQAAEDHGERRPDQRRREVRLPAG